jgi:hypothetical protein
MGLGRALAFGMSTLSILGPCLAGCAAHARGEARLQANSGTGEASNADVEAEVDADGNAAAASPASSGSRSAESQAADGKLGLARLDIPTSEAEEQHTGIVFDLSLKSDAAHRRPCGCLSVAYGRVDDSQFEWKSDSTLLRRDPSAFAIAISGIARCDSTSNTSSGALQASISGIARQGKDIVLTVEPARGGKPIARGVMTPQPDSGAKIVVRSKGNRNGVCEIPVP